jgi:abnormal spindle-like microcephaly-associated protein
MLLTFAKWYLSGEGDFVRRLAFLDYTVSVEQSELDEFDFSVKCLATDLCDGIRLCRLSEILSREHVLMRVCALFLLLLKFLN